MGSGSAVVDISNEITLGQSTLQDLLTYVLTFATYVTGVRKILGRHKDVMGRHVHMSNIDMNWTYFTNTLVVDEKIVNFDTGN